MYRVRRTSARPTPEAALKARPCTGMRDGQPLSLADQHANQLLSAQHQCLQALQLGIGQWLDETLPLWLQMQYTGESSKHAHPASVLAIEPCARANRSPDVD